MKNFNLFSKRSLTLVFLFCAMVFTLPQTTWAKVKSKKIVINTDNGAKIYVDGKMIAENTTEIKVQAYSTVNVKVEKVGYIPEERNYVNDDSHELPKSDYIKLEADDAYENSFTTDVANHDIDLPTNMKEDAAWTLISRIITGSFDVIQTTDKATGYLCTAWIVKNFRAATIRTRLIIKSGSSDPLVYKVKLVSEIGKAGATASQDEMFKPWDRVLRTYENVIPDLKSRLGKQ